MRSRFSEALMGIGGIFVSFGFTVIIIGLFARHATNTRAEFPNIATLATGAVVVGAVLFGAGFILHRLMREGDRSSAEGRTSA